MTGMARELVAVAARTPELREYTLPALEPGTVQVVSELGAVKHGTELMGYRGEAVFNTNRYDREMRILVPKSPEEVARGGFPISLGNMIVGRVEAVGEGVTRFAPGDRVYGHLPLRDVQVVAAERLAVLPADMAPEAALCTDPVDAALAMRDAHVRVGDRVAVFGLGAIGLFAVQLCKLSGASAVIACDPVPHRRALAERFGADVTLDPTQGDVGLEIHKLTGGLGADVTLEVSGNSRALHQAIRATKFEGTVAVIAAYSTNAVHLNLGDEFHWNAISLVSCRTVSLPLRDYGWDHERILSLAETLLRTGKLQYEGVLDPIVPFEETPAAYKMIDADPAGSVKLGVRFSS
jgi:threonine dehydrogenase-like Zn-dependent dehydrogenase